MGVIVHQIDLLENATERALLDQLLDDARLYRSSEDYRRLLAFVVSMRNFAPFNALLLQVQKPGLLFAASRMDWRERFSRTVKQRARPLLILWPFGPVALVYDVVDTEGEPLPDGVSPFAAQGAATLEMVRGFAQLLGKKGVHCVEFDGGDGSAGAIEVVRRPSQSELKIAPRSPSAYKLSINRNHDYNVQFVTIAHELAHLYLGHLGADKFLGVPDRRWTQYDQREVEAESVAHVVCARKGVINSSTAYLSDFVGEDTTMEDVDVYQVMRAAGQIEALLGLSARIQFDRPQARSQS